MDSISFERRKIDVVISLKRRKSLFKISFERKVRLDFCFVAVCYIGKTSAHIRACTPLKLQIFGGRNEFDYSKGSG